MQIVLAPDKFKSSLDARSVSRAMREGASRSDPGARVIECPLADGGEGSVDVLLEHLGGVRHEVAVRRADGRPARAAFAELNDGRSAVEMAAASGLSSMRALDPLRASSLGTGDLIEAASRSSESVIVFVGGSASTDGGTGAARAVGWEFDDRDGRPIPLGGGGLNALSALRRPSSSRLLDVLGACDVSNTLIGPDGAARVFAPQKGATANDVVALERGLEHLAATVLDELNVDIASIPHGGAGGGMGAGLVAFFGGRLTSGFEIVARAANLDAALARADLVITGEGRLDATSFSGKVVSGVVTRARAAKVPCAAVVGASDISEASARDHGIDHLVTLADSTPDTDPQAGIAQAVEMLLRRIR